MNSLEWINGQIENYKESKNKFLSLSKEYPNNDTFPGCVKSCEEKLQTLNQIKTELEAWEVVKKCLSISTDSWDEYSKSFEFISFTVAGVHPLLGFDRQEIESIKKALEVKDE